MSSVTSGNTHSHVDNVECTIHTVKSELATSHYTTQGMALMLNLRSQTCLSTRMQMLLNISVVCRTYITWLKRSSTCRCSIRLRCLACALTCKRIVTSTPAPAMLSFGCSFALMESNRTSDMLSFCSHEDHADTASVRNTTQASNN